MCELRNRDTSHDRKDIELAGFGQRGRTQLCNGLYVVKMKDAPIGMGAEPAGERVRARSRVSGHVIGLRPHGELIELGSKQGERRQHQQRRASCLDCSSLWLDCRHYRKICQIGRVQPENLQVLFGVPILLGLRGTPCVEAGVTAEDGPNSRNRRRRSDTGGLGSTARTDDGGGVCHGYLIFSAWRSSL
jgi:hypothetical protein